MIWLFLVICLSDDDDDDDNNNNHVNSKSRTTPIKQKESLTIVNNSSNDASNWTIHEKDIIYVSSLPMKYSDVYKKPFEIRCSSVYFGLVQFNVESEVIMMKETEFEMKLTGMKIMIINIRSLNFFSRGFHG